MAHRCVEYALAYQSSHLLPCRSSFFRQRLRELTLTETPEWSPAGSPTHIFWLLATPAAALAPTGSALRLPATPRGGSWNLGNPGFPYHKLPPAQAFAPDEATPVLLYKQLEKTRETSVTSYKSRAYWRKLGRYGLSPTVGGIIAFHWSATARLKLGSPRPIGC